MFKRDKKPEPTATENDQKKNLFFQPKLAFGRQGDSYEVEADKMADKVVGNTHESNAIQQKEEESEVQQKSLATEISPLIQKAEALEEEPVQKQEEEEAVQSKEEEEPIQKQEEEEAAVQSKEEEEPIQKQEEEEEIQSKEEEEPIQKQEEEEAVQSKEEEEPIQKQEEEEAVQTKAENKGLTPNQSSFESKLRGGEGGQKMDAETLGEMESGFGADFSRVNIHNDSEAAQMSQEIGAQAFTHGNDIYFNEGKYNPNSKGGKHLLAHELTHTIQQKGMVQKKIQKIGIDDVRDQMKGREFTVIEDHGGIKKDTVIKIIDWKDNKGDVYGFYINAKKAKIYTMFPKEKLIPKHTASSKITKYEVGLSGQKTAVKESQKKLDEWRDKEKQYKKNRGLWETELKRLEGIHEKKEKTMSQMLVRETMYNRFDDYIIKWVDHYNSKFKPATKLSYNIVKSIIYQETRMGTSGVHLEKGPYKYDSAPFAIKSIYNLGQVIDSFGPQQYLMIKEMAPSVYKKFGFDALEKKAAWKGMSGDEWVDVKIFDAIKEYSRQRDASGENLMGSKKDLLLTYEFWIRATVRWLFEKYFIKKNWPDAVKAYNGSGKKATSYKDAVIDRANKKGTLNVGNK